MPAEDIIEPDEFDAPADESHLMQIASPSLIASQILPSSADESSVEPDEFDSPAQNPCKKHTPSAGEQLALSNPDAEWPEAIEPLRKLFFTSEAIIPFAAPEYVFIRAPLTEESGMNSCLCGICCESGIPARVCYAIPAPYTAEPPAGMEGYIWRGDHLRGYWTICENLTSSDGTLSS